MLGVGCREEETESCMDLNFSTFEWYVTKKVSVCEMASWRGVYTKSALLNVDRNVEKFVEKYFAHIPPSVNVNFSTTIWAQILFHALGAHTPTAQVAAIFRFFFLFTQCFARRAPKNMIYLEPAVALATPRVPGLPIRDCARGCNSRAQICSQLSAIIVTEKTFFERLYLVLGLSTFGPWINCPYAPTTPPIHFTTISRFPSNFFHRMAPQFFWYTIHQVIWPSPGTLATPL